MKVEAECICLILVLLVTQDVSLLHMHLNFTQLCSKNTN